VDPDLAVVGRDPLFGDGGLAQVEAFTSAATALGHRVATVFDPHPGLRGPRATWRRVEAFRIATAPSRVEVPPARSLWVVSTHASDGYAAFRSGRPYTCWIGTTVESEWAGRRELLNPPRRVLAGASVRAVRAVERRVLRGAKAVYATSPASRDAIAAASGRRDVGILPIPVDVDKFSPASDEAWAAAVAARRIVFVGRADDPRKNIGLLLDAARLLPDLRVVLAGAPPTKAELPSNVEALGPVEDVAVVLRQGAMLVLPSLQEGFGIVAAEALACGLPVVSTPCGGPEALVRSSGAGAVTDTFEPVELAGVIKALLGSPADLQLMRRQGRAFVEREHSPGAFRRALADALANEGA
jgi:glycosyltransferase involved in cell wall biosynthesis